MLKTIAVDVRRRRSASEWPETLRGSFNGEDLVLDEVEADYAGHIGHFEVATDRVENHLAQLLYRLWPA
jgi:hypothetical protein